MLGGRAPQFRWGSGSLQEIDHLPLVRPVTKHAATVTSTEEIPAEITRALTASLTTHRGPSFLDMPLEVIFSTGDATVEAPRVAGIRMSGLRLRSDQAMWVGAS